MTKRILLSSFAIASTIAFSGCATLFSGKTQQVSITSEPKGAVVKLNGSEVGTTPFTAHISKKKDAIVTIEKDGYESQVRTMGSETEGFFYMNILGSYSSSTSSAIDYTNGSYINYSPANYHFELKSK